MPSQIQANAADEKNIALASSSASSTQPPHAAAAAQHAPTPPPIDLQTIPSQIGHAILSPDGSIVQRVGSLSERDAGILYRMMLEVGTVVATDKTVASNKGGVRRVTVGFGGVSYVVGVGGDGCLYIVKKKSS